MGPDLLWGRGDARAGLSRHPRKFWAIYASLQELGPLTLSNEKAWFTLATTLSSSVNKASAGCSQVFKVILLDLFCEAVDPRAGGIFLQLSHGAHIRIFIEMRIFMLDGDAHRAHWCCKGEGGIKHSLQRANLYSDRSGIADAADELVLATDDSVFAAVDRLAAKKRVETDAVFRQREKVVGLNHEPDGIFLATELRGGH